MAEVQVVTPDTEYAVQLVGSGRMVLNRHKAVVAPGPHQILARVEAVGLCFSDLKLLKQFATHPRKGAVTAGLPPEVLAEIPSYTPGEQPGVPGHEVACRIVATGSAVTHHRVGERCLVQTDYRFLPTHGANAAFGYNFEGGLQEYVLMDERVVIDPQNGDRFLIPVSEEPSASAVALVEPWACVEDSYAYADRRTIKPGGRMLVVVEAGHAVRGLAEAIAQGAPPAELTAVCQDDAQRAAIASLGIALEVVARVQDLPDEAFDDIVYFGASKATIELLNDKLAPQGIIALVLGGQRIGEPVSVGVGRIHYHLTRWIGVTGEHAAHAYRTIPASGELRPHDRVLILGAGGPMGQMHVIRAVSAGIPDLTIVGTDIDDARLETIRAKAEPPARQNGVALRLVNTAKEALDGRFSYHVILVPAGALVAAAVRDAAEGALINIFAGIPAGVRHELDLDTYVERHLYMFGTSGSLISDMKVVLAKVESGRLDTNTSIDAVSGMAGAVDALKAIEDRTLAGKIVVYPMVHEVGLIPLATLEARFPTVAAKLEHGTWCRAAEDELLRVAGTNAG
jgi:threonine dehydrogenase-like Zn-dependent dehydrogenase